MEPWIETATGRKFWFDGRKNDIHIEDIALALSKLCRYTGHCNTFYSVAEHSVNTSLLVGDKDMLGALLHDASEAYLADIASPVKMLLPEYKKLEDMIQSQIDEFFGVNTKTGAIKQADWGQLKIEAYHLLPSKGKDWYFPPDTPTGWAPIGYDPRTAYTLFMEQYEYLTNERQKAA